jgi:hypothetical protein
LQSDPDKTAMVAGIKRNAKKLNTGQLRIKVNVPKKEVETWLRNELKKIIV